MEELKLTIEAIRLQLKLTRAELAASLGISLDRYNRIVSGESKMLASELVLLHQVSGIPYEMIEVPSVS